MSAEDTNAQILAQLARMDEGIKVRREQTEKDIRGVQSSMEKVQADFKADLETLKTEVLGPLIKDVREVRDSMMYAKGGWKVLIALGGLGAAVGALLTKVPWEKIFALKSWSS